MTHLSYQHELPPRRTAPGADKQRHSHPAAVATLMQVWQRGTASALTHHNTTQLFTSQHSGNKHAPHGQQKAQDQVLTQWRPRGNTAKAAVRPGVSARTGLGAILGGTSTQV